MFVKVLRINPTETDPYERLSRWHAALSGVSRAAISTRSRDLYPTTVARVLVEKGAFAMASIMWHRPETNELVPIARWGDSGGYTDQIRIFTDHREEGRGPGGTAFRRGLPVICNDFLNDPNTLPWREAARSAGWRSAAAIPIRVNGESRGLLAIYDTEVGFFGASETELLQQVADDIGFVLNSFDVEEQRQQATVALAVNQRRLMLAMDAAGIGAFEWDLETAILVWEGRLEQMFGLEPDEFDGTRAFFEQRVHPEDLPGLKVAEEAARKARNTFSREFRILWPDGSSHWVLSRAEFFYDEPGAPPRLCGVVLDIDERKKSEQSLKLAEERFRHALDSMIEGCMLIDFGWKYLYVNEEAARQNFLRQAEMVGRCFWDLFPGVEHAPFFTSCKVSMLQRIPQRCQQQFTAANGETHWYEISVVPVPEGIFVLSLDVTEPKRAEQTRNTMVSLVEASHDFIGIASLDGKLTYLNNAAQVMVGLAHSDAEKPVSIYDLFSPEEKQNFIDAVEPKFRQEGWARRETSLRNFHTREPIPVDLQAVMIRNEQGSAIGMATVARDLTERREAERQRGKLEVQLAQARKMEALGRLTGGIAHDFNNSLAVVIGYASLLAASSNLSAEQQESIKAVMNAATRSSELVGQLMGFSRQQMITPTPLDLNRFVVDSGQILARLVGEDVEFQTVASEGLWIVLLDPMQVDQILMNLVANARDAMPDGGKLTLETRNVRLDAAEARENPGAKVGEYVLLEVRDTGTGMDAETIAQVFEPFFSTKERGKGTGLGLATVYGIVRQNEGFIRVLSEPGNGTTFQVCFPRFADASVAPAKVGVARQEVSRKGSGTILLVEDDVLVRDMTADALRFLGYTPLVARGAAEALALCTDPAIPIDLVISDVVMPDMKGTDLRDEMVKLRANLKVLFVSGYTSNVVVRYGMTMPGVHFLQKPFSFLTLTAKIEEILHEQP